MRLLSEGERLAQVLALRRVQPRDVVVRGGVLGVQGDRTFVGRDRARAVGLLLVRGAEREVSGRGVRVQPRRGRQRVDGRGEIALLQVE